MQRIWFPSAVALASAMAGVRTLRAATQTAPANLGAPTRRTGSQA